MINRLRIPRSGFFKFLVLICFLQLGSGYLQAQFTAGNLVVCSPNGNTSVATAITLFQYSTTGTLVNSTVIPSSGASQLTISGSATTEGFLSLSAEKDRLVFVGYDVASPTAGVAEKV